MSPVTELAKNETDFMPNQMQNEVTRNNTMHALVSVPSNVGVQSRVAWKDQQSASSKPPLQSASVPSCYHSAGAPSQTKDKEDMRQVFHSLVQMEK